MLSMLRDKLLQTTAGTGLIAVGIVYYYWRQRRRARQQPADF